MSTETIEIEVRPEHLQRARKNLGKDGFDRGCQCLVAEACKDSMPDFTRCYPSRVETELYAYGICEQGQSLIAFFDIGNYHEIHLPQTITLTRCK